MVMFCKALEVGLAQRMVICSPQLERGMLGEHLRCGKVLFLHLDGKHLGEPTL